MKKNGYVVHIFKNNKTFDKFVLQHWKEITLDSGIETTIIIYQVEAYIKLHNILWSQYVKSFRYPNSIVYITYRGFKVFDAPFLFYLLPVLFNRVIKDILVPTLGYLYTCSISMYSSKKIRQEKKERGCCTHFQKQQNIW